MKKRVLSLLMAVAMCLSMLPTTALAEELATGTEAEQVEQPAPQEPEPVEEPGVPEGDPEEQETPPAPEEKSDEAVKAAQALIAALPEDVTAENAAEIEQQLMALDAALEALTDEQLAQLDMTRYEALCAALAELTAEQENGHSHPICGDTSCNKTEHQLPSGATWTAINNAEELKGITKAGYYYLTDKVELTKAWYPKDGVVLCLNGKAITMNDGSNNYPTAVIRVNGGVTFTLCDCKNTGTVTHGRNSDGKTYDGSGVWVKNDTYTVGAQANFVLYGGSISGNAYSGAAKSGAGVYLGEGGHFTMHGGSISGNSSAGTGGGVCVYDSSDASFTMTGGSITGNSAGFSGGGVYVSNGTFTMTGGSITGNTVGSGYNGGGVYATDKATVTLSGAPVITGNTGADGTVNNLYLYKYWYDENDPPRPFTIGEGGLSSSVDIGVTVDEEALPTTDGGYITIAKAAEGYTITADDAKRVSADAGAAYNVRQKDNTLVLVKGELPHEHPICGKTCDHTDKHNENLKWTGVSDLSKITAGSESNPNYYYLTKDIELDTAGWSAMDYVVLDLCGHSITANEAFDAITVGDGAHFTLTDCKGDNGNYGSITHYKNPNNNTQPRKSGRGVMVSDGGHFTMYGGCIGPNLLSSGDAGAGVYVASGANFTMLGGEIAGNMVPNNNGGGIWTAGTTTIGGDVRITGNSAKYGGGVYVNGGTLMLLDNAAVTGNSARSQIHGCGIFVGAAGKLKVSGSVQVTGNEYSGYPSNVYLDGTTTITPIAVVGALAAEVSISVNMPKTVLDTITDDNSITIATANEEGWIKDGNFVNENGNTHTIYVTNGGKTAVLGTHAHEWEYTASKDGYTITAKCKNENCTSNGGSVTIKAPTGDLTYDGNEKAATLEGNFNTSVTPTISYTVQQKGGVFVALPAGEIPTNAGYYQASITVGGVTAFVRYDIDRATLTAEDFTFTPPENLVYDGNEKVATVTCKKSGAGAITVWYQNSRGGIAEDAIDVGTYTVRILVGQSTNYESIPNSITGENWTFTITQAGYTVNVPDSWKNQTVIEGSTLGSAIYRITNYNQTTVTVTGVNNESLMGRVSWYTNEACTESVDDNAKFEEEAGTTVTLYWKFVFADEYQNYTTKDETGSVDFKIVKGPQQGLSFEDASGEKVTEGTAKYGGNPLYLNVRNETTDGGAITYASSNEKVATVQDNGNGKITVTICGVGTTKITATAARVDGQFAKTTATYTLKVEKGEWDGLVAVDMTGYVYNGNVKTPYLSSYYTGDSKDVTYYYSTTDTNTGGTKWENIGPTTLDAGDYFMYAEIAATANYEAYTTKASPFTVYKAWPVGDPPANVTATYGQKLGDITLTNPAGNTPGTWSWVDDNQPVGNASTTVKAFKAIFTPTDTVNYEVVSGIGVSVLVKPAAGSNLATVNRAQKYGDTGEYTFAPSWAGLPAGQTWNYACEYSVGAGSNATLTKKDIDDHGKLTYVISGAKAGDVVTITLKAQCNNYEDYTITLKITIEQAATTGEPGYSKITSRGKTLADVGLTVGTLNPSAGEFEWIDEEGNVLPGDTKVESNKSYTWRFTPTDPNYAPLTGSITPWENITIIVPTYPTDSGNVSNPSTGAAGQGSIACGVAVLAAVGVCLLGARRKNHE